MTAHSAARQLHDGPISESRPEYLWSRILVATMCLAAFGPYLVGSMRTEQLVVYAMVFPVFFTLRRLPRWAFRHLLAWLWIVLVATIGVLFPYTGPQPWEVGSKLAGYDNLLLPLMVMLSVWCFVPADGAGRALWACARVVSLASAANAIIAALSTVMSLTGLLRPFWARVDILETVADRAETMGRYTGIFGQPAEAGLMYSVAAVLTIWRFARRPALMYLLLSILTVGGLLSVSKVFLLVGLPVTVALLWVWNGRVSTRVSLVLVLLLAWSVVGTSSFFRTWTGFGYLTRLLKPPDDVSFMRFYSAGRWGGDTHMSDLLSFIFDASPWIGVGAGGLQTAFDAQWAEMLVLSGLFGTLGLIVVLILLFNRTSRISDREVRLLGRAFFVVVLGGSLGITSLTANRTATVVWIVATLLISISHVSSESTLSKGSPNM